MARHSGAKVIALSRFGQTSLAKNSDICFGLSAPEVAIRCGAMSSRIAQMNMIDIIFSCVVSQNYHEVKAAQNYLLNWILVSLNSVRRGRGDAQIIG